MRILMCRPTYFGVEYEINPWMNINSKVKHALALKQWETLYQTIKTCGAQIELVEPIKGWPDMVFTANAGLKYQGKIILSHFKFKEREGEVPYFKKWFKEAGFQLLNEPANKAFFEGAGDALLARDKLFTGFGFRTERQFYEEVPFLDKQKLIYCELSNPYFYHLDTCFCPLTDKLAIWYRQAFTKESASRMENEIEFISVNENEAKRFACNAVVLGTEVILPKGCPNLSEALEKKGFTVHSIEVDEYLKSGGACKCLTLSLD